MGQATGLGSTHQEGPTDRSLRILLAEDDDDVRRELTQLLRRAGHLVQDVANGVELLDAISSLILHDRDEPQPDVIVTDVRMPGFNGLSLVEGLRANGWRQPVIIISAYEDQAMRDRVGKLSDVALIGKPLDVNRLEDLLGGVPARVD